ncbi:MAG: ABC transporter substrate-binding protein [Thermoprotei archaeon]|nr:MAG: ABC transporter substrate-binding protein [Thermoprotei archaeon]
MKSSTMKIIAGILSLVITLQLSTTVAFATVANVSTYSIAYGDWGVPTPFHHHRGPSYVLTSFIWDTLIWKDHEGYVPLLAESWEVEDGGLKWVFKLREGVKWHDGHPFTADDVKFTFEYLKSHPYPWGSDEIIEYVDRVEVLNNYTIAVYLKKPYADFLDHLIVQLEIIPRHVWENITDPLRYTEPEAFVGTGPFKFKDYKKGAYYVLEANSEYFLGEPVVDKLMLKCVSNPAIALQTGDVDAASFYGKEVDVVRELINITGLEVVEGPSYWVLKLIFNTRKYPLSDENVRRALAYAVNREEIVEKVLHGGGVPASLGIIYPGSKWYNPNLPVLSYNVSEAKGLLDRLGFIDRDGDGVREAPNGTKLSFELLCVKRYDREAELVKVQLGEIGVALSVKVVDWKVADSLLDKGEFDIAISGHGGILRPWTPVDWPAHTYVNEHLDDLLESFYSTLNESERLKYVYEFQQIIAEDLPVLTLYHPKTYVVYNSQKPVEWFWTWNGIGGGVPMWWNKLALIKVAAPTPPITPAAGGYGPPTMIYVGVAIAAVVAAAGTLLIYLRLRSRS